MTASTPGSSRPTTSGGSTPRSSTPRSPGAWAAPSWTTWARAGIAVGRDCRLSSPELAAAFVEGARSQGADGDRHRRRGHRRPLLPRGPPRPRRGRDRHRFPQPEGVERDQDGAPRRARPLRRRRDQGDPRVGDGRPLRRRSSSRRRAALRDDARGLRPPLPLLRGPRRDPPPQGRPRRRERHGRGGRPRPSSSTCRSRPSGCTSSSTGPSPTTPPTPCWRRTGGTSSRACARSGPTSASPGTATPTAASSSTTRASTCPATS